MAKKKKGLIATLATALVLTALGTGAGIYIKSLSPRTTIQEEGMKIYVEGLSYYSGSDKISGTVYKPQDTTGKKPVVIWCHELGEDSKSGDQLCRMVAGKGCIAYSFDFRGGSLQSKSTGDPLKMSVLSEKKDLETVISKIRKEEFVNSNRIYLAGYGLGGLVASLASEEKGVKGLILIAPLFNLPDMCELQYPKNRQIQTSNDFAGITEVGKQFITDGKGLKPYKGLSKFDGDVLIIHGTADQTVPVDYSTRAASEFGSADLQTIEGAGHSISGKTATKVLSLIGAYLDNQKK